MSQIKFTPEVNKKFCKKCELCVRLCPRGVFDLDREGYPFPARAEECHGCGRCLQWCPDFAIEIKKINLKQDHS